MIGRIMSQKIEQKIVFLSNTTFARKYHNTYSFLSHPVSFRLLPKKEGKGVVGGKNCDPETGGEEEEEEDEGRKRK